MKKRTPSENGNGSSGQEPNSLATSLSGCLYLLVVLSITTGMLIVNAIVCLSIHSAFMNMGSQPLADSTLAPHLGQLFFFLVPILLTVIQWNLLDRLDRLFRRP